MFDTISKAHRWKTAYIMCPNCIYLKKKPCSDKEINMRMSEYFYHWVLSKSVVVYKIFCSDVTLFCNCQTIETLTEMSFLYYMLDSLKNTRVQKVQTVTLLNGDSYLLFLNHLWQDVILKCLSDLRGCFILLLRSTVKAQTPDTCFELAVDKPLLLCSNVLKYYIFGLFVQTICHHFIKDQRG